MVQLLHRHLGINCISLRFLCFSSHWLVRSLFAEELGYFAQYSKKLELVVTSMNQINYSLKIAVLIARLMPFFADEAASRSFEYNTDIKVRISPVAEHLLDCSACSSSIYLI